MVPAESGMADAGYYRPWAEAAKPETHTLQKRLGGDCSARPARHEVGSGQSLLRLFFVVLRMR
jgi:hypothetical protein